MSFKSYNGVLRKIGRQAVLPVEKIKSILAQEIFGKETIDICVDFGAGTLFWAEWLKDKVKKMYAVDIIFGEGEEKNGIICVDDIDKISYVSDGKREKKMFFAVDVFHHLSRKFEKELLLKINNKFDCIIIKDINCQKKIGNFMNRVHDKVINGEHIRDVDPDILIERLSRNGYKCKIYSMRKLWYPHFMIIAKR